MIRDILDHLWQSTWIAAALGFAAWAFRNHRAHVRYALARHSNWRPPRR
jgi:hypothetical protein